MKNKILSICAFLFAIFLCASCSNKKTVYRSISQSDWLLRNIYEDIRFEFDLKEKTFLITDNEISYQKDLTKKNLVNTWYGRGTYEGDPQIDGIIELTSIELSDDGGLTWTTPENSTISIFDDKQIEVADGQFGYEDYVYYRIENNKMHKQIDKKFNEYNELKELINNLEQENKVEQIQEQVEKIISLKEELQELKGTEFWTDFDEFDFHDLEDTVSRKTN